MTRRKVGLLFRAVSISVLVVAAGLVGPDGASAAASLSANPTTIIEFTSTTVSWTINNLLPPFGPPPTPKDWIGLYTSSTDPDTAFVAWQYTDSADNSGSEQFSVADTYGTGGGPRFQFRLFSNNGYTRLATAGPISILNPGVRVHPSLNPIARGGTESLTWSGVPSPRPTDWIGLYHSPEFVGDERQFVAWRYTNSTVTSAGMPFTIPADIAPGTYEFLIFRDNGYQYLTSNGSDEFQVTM